MSSAPAPGFPLAAAPPAAATYWCHECDMSITLSSSDLHCPHCRSLFLEVLDAPTNHPLSLSSDSSDDSESYDDYQISPPAIPSPNPNPTNPDSSNPNPTAYLQLLIQHLTGDDDSISPSDLPLNRGLHCGPSPASKSSIESIPTVEISDPSLVCAICKDEFFLGSAARRLPCSHMYHSDCIVPWLSSHNSCPLCRFRLPRAEGDEGERQRVSGSLRFGGRILRGIVRRPRIMLRDVRRAEEEEGVTATQMAEAEGSVGPTNSGETVSSSERPPTVADGGDSAAVLSRVRDWMEE